MLSRLDLLDHFITNVKPKLRMNKVKMINKMSGAQLVMMLIILLMIGSSRAAADNSNNDIRLYELTGNADEVVKMAGYGDEKLSTVLITGSLHCHPHFPTHTHAWPIPGATVAVTCQSHGSERRGKSAVVARGATDEFGDFVVDLPSHLHAIPNLEKICKVRVHRMPKTGTLCRPAYIKRHKQLSLSSFGNGIRTYSAGNIRLHHSTSSEAGN